MDTKKQLLKIILIAVLAFLLIWLVYYFVDQNRQDQKEDMPDKQPNNNQVQIQQEYEGKIVYTSDMEGVDEEKLRQDCQNRGGKFQECGSVCAPEADICAEVCAYTCVLPSKSQDVSENYSWIEYKNLDLGFSLIRIEEMEVGMEGENRVEFILEGPTQEQGTELYDGIRVLISRVSHEPGKSLKELGEDLAGQTTEATGEILSSVELDNEYSFATYRFKTGGLGNYTHLLAPIYPGSAFEISYFSTDDKYDEQIGKMLKSFEITDKEKTNTFIADKIEVNSPKPEQTVSSPFMIKGQARGNWFFEASFTAVLTDWDGRIIGEAVVETSEPWMTKEFIPFSAEMRYTLESDYDSDLGYLILQKSNPSGLPKNDEALEFPVYLQ